MSSLKIINVFLVNRSQQLPTKEKNHRQARKKQLHTKTVAQNLSCAHHTN